NGPARSNRPNERRTQRGPGITQYRYRYSVTAVIPAAAQSTGRDVAGGREGGIEGLSAASVAPIFPPCKYGYYHPYLGMVLRHPAASNRGCGRLGVTQRQPRFVAPENQRQEQGELGSVNTAVGAALCWMAGVNTHKSEGGLHFRS
ncbi:Hypothetical predicted protein, partial [Xyrichtys novacula]